MQHDDIAKFGGVFDVEILDEQGNPVSKVRATNTVVNEGKSKLLARIFNSGADESGSLYIVPIAASPAPSISATTTYSDIGTAFTEWTNYTQGTRYSWTPGTEASQSVTNASGTVDIQKTSGTSPENVYGFAIVNKSNKGDAGVTAGGWLLSAAQFDGGTQSVQTNYTLRITYTFSA